MYLLYSQLGQSRLTFVPAANIVANNTKQDVLMKAAYAFTDDVYVHLDCDNENYMVSVTSKLDESEENIFNKFENELIAQETRKIIAGQTKNIREMIVARALSSTMVHLNEENVKDEESFDAKEISKSWFDKNE